MKAPASLLLSPSVALSHPRAWQNIPSLPTYDRISEVHCIGGGTLLLWLLVRAKRIPRVGHVTIHGPMVLPTAESCAHWVATVDSSYVSNERVWRKEALCLGLDGALPADDKRWLAPILREAHSSNRARLRSAALDSHAFTP
mmetsp:Transcript_92211/g.276686  ORF Transcript_92211/g.276686 Transcript_92211/m.276686 type:complete len:142 (-) Transcript_92211:256-681(-)